MDKSVTVRTALEKLEEVAFIAGEWKSSRKPSYDGSVTFTMDGTSVTLPVIVGRELRKYQVPHLSGSTKSHPSLTEDPLLMVAERISPTLREELREARISYLEASGNFFLCQPGTFSTHRRSGSLPD